MYDQREIILVPFPYSDLSSEKRRPVLIVSNNDYNRRYDDVVVVVISSNIRSDDKYSVLFSNEDLDYGILPEKSKIKAHKLFTINKKKIVKKFSIINKDKFKDVNKKLAELFKLEE